MISAEVICDSISPQGKRITTFKLRYPKFIHGEFMTHRVISRNASSSRAIPTKKLLEEVRSDALRAAPVFWGKNQSGMQAAEELDATVNYHLAMSDNGEYETISDLQMAQKLWRGAAGFAAMQAEQLLELGAHKQIVNRLLEPFSHINVIATATEWDNFFGLRLHKDAQPEMRALALAMWQARQASVPFTKPPGDWHLPFIGQFLLDGESKLSAAWELPDPKQRNHNGDPEEIDPATWIDLDVAIKVSVARCARVSYESFETGKRSTVEEDLKLYDRLLGAQPLHASPAEHQATPDTQGQTELMAKFDRWDHRFQWGNFVGWRQYRKMLPNEAVAPLPEGF